MAQKGQKQEEMLCGAAFAVCVCVVSTHTHTHTHTHKRQQMVCMVLHDISTDTSLIYIHYLSIQLFKHAPAS